MDKKQAASIAVIAVNKYKDGKIQDYELIKDVCKYFDAIKNEILTQADLKFLKYISNVVGIPHYYDVLKNKFEQNIDIDEFGLNTLSACMTESTLHLTETYKLHKFQKEILDKFRKDTANRYFLSASTSFGKTHLIYDIIDKMSYKNIVLIFPTIALLSENLEKLLTDERYSHLKENFSIHTLSDVLDNELGDKNIFIYTPERFLSYTDKNSNLTNFDFIFIDEIYKLDNEYIIDDAVKENERDVAYRLATFQALHRTKDLLLAGPYIEVLSSENPNYNESFDLFLTKNQISKIDYNKYEIVGKIHKELDEKTKNVNIDENLSIEICKPKTKKKRLLSTIKAILNNKENSIVYCMGAGTAESRAKEIMLSGLLDEHNIYEYKDFLDHIKTNFDENWIIYKALSKGIGIHHGLVPKFIQKEIINLFNAGMLKILLSTTTITEGVNTTAKNLIVMTHKKGDKKLKPFDAKNIAGRAGRFLNHYMGRVIVIDDEFEKIIEEKDAGIKHKNYDKTSPKDDVDLFFTENEYLSKENLLQKQEIKKQQRDRGLPEVLFEQFKAVSRKDKIIIYDEISKLTKLDHKKINALIAAINQPKMSINKEGLQVIINTVLPIVKSGSRGIYSVLNLKDKSNKYSIFVHLLYFYLQGGFDGALQYKINNGKEINVAMRETADFVYNLLKYHAVKYLGVFNLMYKYIKSGEDVDKIENVTGIDKLLSKLEYNALSPIGRKVSDYGVPSNVLVYYEEYNKETGESSSQVKFDNYEKNIFQKVKNVI